MNAVKPFPDIMCHRLAHTVRRPQPRDVNKVTECKVKAKAKARASKAKATNI